MARKKEETDSEGIRETLMELKDQIGDIERDFVNNVKMKAKSAERKMEDKIEKNPKGSVGTAFGVGALIGMVAYALLRKKK